MSSVNERQVGGDHYKGTTLQHWDIMAKYKVPYLEGHLTKYLRHRKKNGLQDVEKMMHFADKLIESVDTIDYTPFGRVPMKVLQQFCVEQSYNFLESRILIFALTWRDHFELEELKLSVQALIDEYSASK